MPKVGLNAAIDGGVEKLSDPATAKRIQGLLASQGMQDIEKELIKGVASAAESALSDNERMARLKSGSGELVGEVTRGALRGAITEANSPEFQKELKKAVSSLIAASSDALGQSLHDADLGKRGATAIREEVGPAVKEALKSDVAPAMAELLQDEKVLKAVGETARAMGYGAVVGATDAMGSADKDKTASTAPVLTRVGEVATKGITLAGAFAVGLTLAVILLLVWVVKLVSQTRRLREEGERRSASARLLSEGLKLAEGKPWSEEFIRSLEAKIAAEEATLSALKKEQREHGWRWRHPGPPAGGTMRHSHA